VVAAVSFRANERTPPLPRLWQKCIVVSRAVVNGASSGPEWISPLIQCGSSRTGRPRLLVFQDGGSVGLRGTFLQGSRWSFLLQNKTPKTKKKKNNCAIIKRMGNLVCPIYASEIIDQAQSPVAYAGDPTPTLWRWLACVGFRVLFDQGCVPFRLVEAMHVHTRLTFSYDLPVSNACAPSIRAVAGILSRFAVSRSLGSGVPGNNSYLPACVPADAKDHRWSSFLIDNLSRVGNVVSPPGSGGIRIAPLLSLSLLRPLGNLFGGSRSGFPTTGKK